MGWNNPPVPWQDLARALSGDGEVPPGDHGDSPAWGRKRDVYRRPADVLPPRSEVESGPRVPYADRLALPLFNALARRADTECAAGAGPQGDQFAHQRIEMGFRLAIGNPWQPRRQHIARRRIAQLDQLACLAFDDIEVDEAIARSTFGKIIADRKTTKRQRRRVDGGFHDVAALPEMVPSIGGEAIYCAAGGA